MKAHHQAACQAPTSSCSGVQ